MKHCNHGSPRKAGAFTLIELLVVIAIIAILAAILFPVFAQAKLMAKKTAGLSNMKQIILASQMYLTDFDDSYHLIRKIEPTGDPLNWANGSEEMLHPYMKNMGIHADPGDGVVRDDCNQPFGHQISFSWSHYRSDDIRVHGLHGYNHPTWLPHQMRPSLNAGAVGAPAQTINLYPLWTTASYSNGYAYYRWYTDQLGTELSGIPTYPKALSFTWCSARPGAARMSIGAYADTTNWGFADGHVKSMNRKQTMIQQYPWTTTHETNGDLNLFHYSDKFKK
jgi:prepilin-type N-terminal cleavage/methylation domain-containing protein/prepilin-type processing-associated H-X9-DG protein